MKITRLRIYDAWSFCKDCPCDVTFDDRNTVIIGKNNSGKSNVLRGLRWITSRVKHNSTLELARNQVHEYGRDQITATPVIELSLELNNSSEIQEWEALISDDPNGMNREVIQATLQRSLTIRLEHEKTLKDKVQLRRHWSPFKEPLADKTARRKQEEFIPKLMDWLHDHLNESITFLGGWRSLATKVEGDKTIVRVLHEMQGADTNNPTYLRVFDKVEAFFLKLTGLRSGQLRPTADGNSLNVRYRDRYLPIQSFGDEI